MKKGNHLLEEQVVEGYQKFYSQSGSLENQDFFLFLTELDSLKVVACNYKGSTFFKKDLKEIRATSENFFVRIIHPEDYPSFLEHLVSCMGLEQYQQKEITVRVKASAGKWKKYIFRNRKYRGFKNEENTYILSTVRSFDSKEIIRNNTANNIETKQNLLESRNKYRALVNSLDDGFAVIEMIFDLEQTPFDYMFLEVNKAFEEQIRLKDPLGKTMREFSPAHKEHWFKTLGEVSLTGKSLRFEKLAPDLNDIWLEVFAFCIGTKKRRKVGLLFSDITERVHAKEELVKLNKLLESKVKQRTKELKSNNKLLQMVFDTVNQGIFVLKPDFGPNGDIRDFLYVRVNQTILRYYKQQEMIGHSFLQLNPAAAKRGVFESFKQTMLTGKSEDFEINFRRNGKNSWFRITCRRHKGVLISTTENITRSKRKTQNLRDNIRFKKQLVETTPDIILIFNLYEEKVKFMNRDISNQAGMVKDDVIGMPLLDIIPLIHPEDRERALEFHHRLLKASDKDIEELEFRLKVETNKWECHNARGKVFSRNKKGNAYEYIIMLRNIQEQKLTQKALIYAEKLSIKGEMARTLAHELRNPLASIGISADILVKKIEANPEQAVHYLEIIKRSTNTLNNLVTDLLTSSNYAPATLKKCCLAEITDAALQQAEDRIYLTGVMVIKKYPHPCYISADWNKLKIALLNIIVNASEAMTPNEGILILDINRTRNSYILSISDNGCGLEKEQLEKLFDSFYTKKPDGIGIGLHSVKNILEEHGAGIRVSSKPKKGTTFYLSFKCHEEEKKK